MLSGVHAQAENLWQVDSALLIYSESDGRVKATEPVVSMKKDLGDEHIISLKFTYDSLTGASPNGAIPTKETKTITGPSGRKSTTTSVGAFPKDEFKDTRSAFNIGWSQPFGDGYHYNVGANYSHEYDFDSNGFNLGLSKDLFNKNTTLSLGFNRESDTVNAVGGVPDGLSANSQTSGRLSSDTKNENDILFGVTQIMTRQWLLQLNYSYASASGYQNDPYKIMSVVDSTGKSVDDPFVSGTGYLYLYENRPDTRKRQSLYLDSKYHLTEDMIDLSYRYYTDDWGIKSSTLDLRYHMMVGESSYLEPHIRLYKQTQADFYKPFLVSGVDVSNGKALDTYASSDPRLADFSANTIGLKYGYEIDQGTEFYVRYEIYKQTGDSSPSAARAMTNLQGLDLYPDLKASTLLFGYRFQF